MSLKSIRTRFRAYQLDSAGSSFSYFSGGSFVLIEARLDEKNKPRISQELRHCNKESIDVLQITSWDKDHCAPSQLEKILEQFEPNKIEYPGYEPKTESGKKSLKTILNYKNLKQKVKAVHITPDYIDSLNAAKNYGYKDIVYWPKAIDAECANNNSTIKQFRTGCFNVLSLGDVESSQISSLIRRSKTVYEEVDVMIMAHHGADNGFTTSAFLKRVKPTIAIVSSNYDNQFEHPKPAIRDLLHKNNIKLFTTKTGDVLVESLENHTSNFRVTKFKANSDEVSSQCEFTVRKAHFLKNNLDTIRDRTQHHNKGPKRR